MSASSLFWGKSRLSGDFVARGGQSWVSPHYLHSRLVAVFECGAKSTQRFLPLFHPEQNRAAYPLVRVRTILPRPLQRLLILRLPSALCGQGCLAWDPTRAVRENHPIRKTRKLPGNNRVACEKLNYTASPYPSLGPISIWVESAEFFGQIGATQVQN
jgi:hypothetical protein